MLSNDSTPVSQRTLLIKQQIIALDFSLSECYLSHMKENTYPIKPKLLAEFLGVSPGFASQIKQGVRKIPPKDCIRVSEHFNVPLYELRPDIYPKDR